jgi:amylosucrase
LVTSIFDFTKIAVEERIFSGTKKLIEIRTRSSVFADYKNLTWMTPHNNQVAGFLRTNQEQKIYCLFNFSDQEISVNWSSFSEHGKKPAKLFDQWNSQNLEQSKDDSSFLMQPYGFLILEAKN